MRPGGEEWGLGGGLAPWVLMASGVWRICGLQGGRHEPLVARGPIPPQGNEPKRTPSPFSSLLSLQWGSSFGQPPLSSAWLA